LLQKLREEAAAPEKGVSGGLSGILLDILKGAGPVKYGAQAFSRSCPRNRRSARAELVDCGKCHRPHPPQPAAGPTSLAAPRHRAILLRDHGAGGYVLPVRVSPREFALRAP